MSKSRAPLLIATAAAGGVGYYLYNAGGSAKAAENKFESDMHKGAASIKARLPGNSPNVESDLKTYGAEAGAKIDNADWHWAELPELSSKQEWGALDGMGRVDVITRAPFLDPCCRSTCDEPFTRPRLLTSDVVQQIAEADKQAGRFKSNVEAYAKEAKAEGQKAVHKFDTTVEEGAAKAKGGISSWFGGSK